MFQEVRLYLESGQTQSEFIKGKTYTRYGFQYWLKKYRDSQEEPEYHLSGTFQEINLAEETQFSAKVLEITTKSGTHIIVYE